jgi:hypothetical protein
MQLAKASSPDPPAPGAVEPELVAPPVVVVRAPAVVAAPVLAALEAALPIVAAVGLEELPPQPATSTPLRSAAATKNARGERVGRFGLVPGCIWGLLLVSCSVCGSVLREGRFPLGIPPCGWHGPCRCGS